MNTYLLTLFKNAYKAVIYKTKANCKALMKESC